MLDTNSDSADPTGTSHSDDYTNPLLSTPTTSNGFLTFDVTLGSGDDGTQVTLLRNGVAVGTPVIAHLDNLTGKVTAQVTDPGPFSPLGLPTGQPNGTYTYSVSLKDTAGNVDNPANRPTLNVTVDMTAPQQPSAPTLAPGNDTGTITNDNVTNPNLIVTLAPNDTNGVLTFTGTAEANNLVRLVDATGTVYGQAYADSFGTYRVQATGIQNDGTYTFYVFSYDKAGNPSTRSAASPAIKVVTAPIAPTPTLGVVASDDTGQSDQAHPLDITTNVQKPTFVGTGKANLSVWIIDTQGNIPGDLPAYGISTGGIVTNSNGVPPTLKVRSDGTFQVQFDRVLPSGVYNLVARTYDPSSGTYADSPVFKLTIIAPGANGENDNLKTPQNLNLSTDTDTGTKGDGVTSTRLYRLVGGQTDPNTLIELFKVGSSDVLASTTSDGSGNFSLRPAAQFVNGTITYYVREYDIAGNPGPKSSQFTVRSVTTTGDYNNNVNITAATSGGQADLMTYNRSTGVFSLSLTGVNGTPAPASNQGPISYGGKDLAGSNFIPFQGDFNGDGKTDFGVYDFSTATYYIEESSSNGSTLVVKQYGSPGHDLPVIGDFDGDGTTDFVVYNPDTATFSGQLSSGPSFQYQFQAVGDQPVVGDYNGDGKTDIAVFRPSTAQWFIQPISINSAGQVQPDGNLTTVSYGWPGVDQAVPADYDGDGKTDIAIYRPTGKDPNQTQGRFYIRLSSGGNQQVQNVGPAGQVASNAIPVALDYNGDGKADPSIYQPSSSQWSFLYSGSGAAYTQTVGTANSLPLGAPLSYRLPGALNPGGGGSSKATPGDFNGDGKADMMTYNRSTGVFNLSFTGGSTLSLGPISYGGRNLAGNDFIPIQGDFNGDGKTDFGVYDFRNAVYYIEESSSNGSTLVVKSYGWPGHDLPLMADYNGDGITDFAVYRPDTATFYAQLSNGPAIQYSFGWPNHDQPVVGDFNGDGKTDIAVFRPSTDQWFIQPISINAAGQVQPAGNQTIVQFGWPGVDKAVPADYNGDGKTDIAVYRPSGSNANQTQGLFYIRSWETGQTSYQVVGTQVATNAIPVALDYDNDGKADVSIYQPSSSQWSFRYSGSGSSFTQTLGTAGALPMGAPCLPTGCPAPAAWSQPPASAA